MGFVKHYKRTRSGYNSLTSAQKEDSIVFITDEKKILVDGDDYSGLKSGDLPTWVSNGSTQIPAAKLPAFVSPTDLEDTINDLVGIDASGVSTLAAVLKDNDATTGLLTQIAGKASASDFNTHINDSVVHVDSGEKASWSGKYTKPSGGIPKTDLASAVQTSLGLADTAIQSHQSVSSANNTASFGSPVVVGTVGSTELKFTMPSDPNTDTHRPIQVNGTGVLPSNTTPLNLIEGDNIHLTTSGGNVTINAAVPSNVKTVQSAVANPDPSGEATAFIADIAQSTNGNITTLTKKYIPIVTHGGASTVGLIRSVDFEAIVDALTWG